MGQTAESLNENDARGAELGQKDHSYFIIRKKLNDWISLIFFDLEWHCGIIKSKSDNNGNNLRYYKTPSVAFR
jgi:hypothetical protein